MDELEKIKKRKMEELLKKAGYGEMKTEIEVDDNNFEELVIEQSKKIPVVVDFWATWCMPCLMISPILEKLAKEYKGKFILAKLNVDNSPITAGKYGVMSIPNVKMFKNGKVTDEFIGAVPEPVARKWLDKNLGKENSEEE